MEYQVPIDYPPHMPEDCADDVTSAEGTSNGSPAARCASSYSPGTAPPPAGPYPSACRPQVRKIMDRGLLKFRKVGTHQRVCVSSIRAFIATERPRRREALAGLALRNYLGLAA